MRSRERPSAERELLVRDRRERQPVERRDPVRRDRRAVLGCGIADIGLELPRGVARRRAAHVAVARHLGEDRRSGDGRTPRVAADDSPLLDLEVGDAEAVDQAQRVLAPQAAESGSQRLEIRHVEAAGVDPTRATDDDRCSGRGAHHERIQLLAAGFGVLLRVVQVRQRPARGEGEAVEVEQDRRRDERARERAPPGLVGTGDEAPLERAIEGEQLPAAPLRARLRAFRFALEASR